MKPVISILVEQQPAKIGQHERNCVEESLELATHIVAKDIRIQLKRKGESVVLDVLQLIFNKKKAYYKGTKGNWNSHMSGLPEVRLRLIERFRAEHGFSSIAEYLSKRVNTPQFPSIEILHQILSALCDVVPNSFSPTTERKDGAKEVEDDAILVAQAAIDFISSCSDDRLKKQPHEILSCTREDLQKLFDRLVITRRKETYTFYEFWRALTLKLITSQSLPLKLFGWDQVSDLIVASARYRPPAKSFIASGAGCSFVDGVYSFAGTTTEDGYAVPGAEVSYVRRIPETEKGSGGKSLTIFRCTMRSQQKWWFLSEADEEQPGTDRDIDYYQHKSKEHEEREPPPDQWITCRNAGVDPPPKLRGEGLMVPPGEEYNTLDHQLAKWAIENGIVELVLGDSLHREIVARSTPLIKFLASMCERDVVIEGFEGTMTPNTYCLQDSHLVLAWKTCTSTADAAVSSELYQLLVSILPSLQYEMAVTLLTHVQMSLRSSTERRYYIPEVAEFCSALAASAPVDAKTGQPLGMHGISDKVRNEILFLLVWSLVTHADASERTPQY
jgi:ubiquitin carboxyl-terminal hydrolase 9/24